MLESTIFGGDGCAYIDTLGTDALYKTILGSGAWWGTTTIDCGVNYIIFVQISQENPTYKPTYVRKKRTRRCTEKYLHCTEWPIDRPTSTAADTATASADDSADAPIDAPA